VNRAADVIGDLACLLQRTAEQQHAELVNRQTRATVSESRTASRRIFAHSRNIASPAMWPLVSLMFLKRSRSR